MGYMVSNGGCMRVLCRMCAALAAGMAASAASAAPTILDLVADPGEINNLVRTGVPLPPGAAALVPLLKPAAGKGE